MYGTIAKLKVKPGSAQAFKQTFSAMTAPPGRVTHYIYQMDTDPNELYLVVVFASKEAYLANAQSPEQHARYKEFRTWLQADPEWHDGEIILHQ
jgi:quinol monooxygenase YgiN